MGPIYLEVEVSTENGQIPDANFWAPHYALIGEYVVRFEWISVHLRFVMQLMIEGPQTTNDSKIRTLVADASIGSLLNSYRSLMLTSDHIDSFGITVINKFHSRAVKSIENRNEIVHGMLAIGWPFESIQPTDQILGYKLKNRRKGATHKPISLSQADFRIKIQECDTLRALIKGMYGCYMVGGWENTFAVTANSVDVKIKGD